jgi:hypothetical protein
VREFVKGICIALIAVGGIGGAIAWSNDRPGRVTWLWRIASPPVALGGLAWFLIVHFQKDKVPDLLSSDFSTFFDRDGFCFNVRPAAQQGVCVFEMVYQNRYGRRSEAHVALRPPSGFFGSAAVPPLTVEIPCAPAAYGIARIPLPIPADLQGARIKLEVGASVVYPEGKGRMLRVREGVVLRTSADFRNAFQRFTLWGFLLGGHWLHFFNALFWKPDRVVFDLPENVKEQVPHDIKSTITTLWPPGSP